MRSVMFLNTFEPCVNNLKRLEMERIVNIIREFIEDNQVSWRLKCLVLVTASSLVIVPIAALIAVLGNNPSTSQTAHYVLIFDVTAICLSLTCWLGLFFRNRNKEYDLAAQSHQETIGTTLQHQSNTSYVENQSFERYAPVGNEVLPVYKSTLSANRCGLSPTQEGIPRNATSFHEYEDVSFPTTRPGELNLPPKMNKGGETYTLYYLEGRHKTLSAEVSLNSDHSQLCSRVPLKCCFDSDKACPNAKKEPNSAEISMGRELSSGNQAQIGFRSSAMHTNQSRQIDVPDRGIKPPDKDIKSYCGTRRTRSLSRKRFRALPVRQVVNLDVLDGRLNSTTSEEDLATNCDPKQNRHTLLNHSKTLPLRQARNPIFAQEEPRLATNEKNFSSNCEFRQNRGSSRRKRSKSTPSRPLKTFEGSEGRSCLKTNEKNFSSNSGRIQPSVDSPTKDIRILPPSPSITRPRLLHSLLSAILTSSSDEILLEMGSTESVYFQKSTQPQASGVNTRDDELDRTFPIVRYELLSSNNYLVHVTMIFSQKEFQFFLSKRGKC